jgi:hypothetical protein
VDGLIDMKLSTEERRAIATFRRIIRQHLLAGEYLEVGYAWAAHLEPDAHRLVGDLIRRNVPIDLGVQDHLEASAA